MAIASPNPKNLAVWYVTNLGFRLNFEYDGNYFVRAQDGNMLEIIKGEETGASQRCVTPGIPATWPSQ